MRSALAPSSWRPVRPDLAPTLGDARRQLHHAAQLATAFGISYLPPRDDDSHTSLAWIAESECLASEELDGVRVTMRVPDLTVGIGTHELPLAGQTLATAATWMRTRLDHLGLDPMRFTLRRHYEIPFHPVANGQVFTAPSASLRELARWFGNAALAFDDVVRRAARASPVRCWPHHFDIATLLTLAPGRTLGVGMEPGDVYYDEPYFYVNIHPAPSEAALGEAPAGGGHWHTHEWIGAVLPGSRLPVPPGPQQRQLGSFLESAITRAQALLPA